MDNSELNENHTIDIKSIFNYTSTLFKWILMAGLTGIISGSVGTAFHKSIEVVTGLREKNNWIILLLPLGGIIIVLLYKLSKSCEHAGTDLIIESVRSKNKIPFMLAPLIFVSTVITHLFGGSAGREGAALQLGGSIGAQVGKLLHLRKNDMTLIVMCGMSGLFSSLFGTPLTATFFVLEVISVGLIYYSALIPCIISALVAYNVSLLFGVVPVRYAISGMPEIDPQSIIRVLGLGVVCAIGSIIFCASLKEAKNFMTKFIKNDYLRVAIGGAAIVALTYIVGTRDYNGAGMDVVARALDGEARYQDFALKIVFTAITIGTGYKGGEIVPTLFIGSTLGCAVAPLFGLVPGFGAAVGLVAVFCGVTNCPVASIILSIELFGTGGMLLFAVACAISYVLSGYSGLYSSQKIMYSKIKPELINIYAK